jgi:hypothetical protein
VQNKGEPLEKTHLRPLHWHRGTEEFHEDNKRLSELPCSEALIFPRRSATSEEAEEGREADSMSVVVVVLLKKMRRIKEKTLIEKRFRSAMNENAAAR